jgi:C-terminal processing protease CtpA/Prc
LSAESIRAALKRSAPRKGRRRPAKGPDLGTLSAFAIDVQMEAINAARRDLYARILPARRRNKTKPKRATDVDLPTSMPEILRARAVQTRSGRFGYLRIFSFSVPDANAFVAEVMRIMKLLPTRGIILDVRNNGGGLIWAAEQLLQLFTDRRIEPERAQFVNSPRTLALVRQNSPSPVSPSIDLTPWIESMSRSVMTAAVHSEGFPITPPENANAIGRKYKGPVALITDALAYSATDMFAAGFRDHELGPIIGVDDNTGAGGANVWSYALLQSLLSQKGSGFAPLPGGCDLRVAIRRTLRVGASAGTPLEDLGVVPDARHYLTRRDVLEQNEDLIAHAGEVLSNAS